MYWFLENGLLDHVIWKLKMAGILLSEIMLEEKLVELWPDYGCLFDVRSPDFKNRDKKQVAIEEIAIKVSWFRFVHTVRKMPLEAKNIKKWEVFSFRPWVAKFHENSAAYKRKQLDKRPYQVVFGGLLKQSKYWRAELALENRVETFLDAYPNSEPLSRLK